MYAGKIRLVGTETGVGVRNAGHIGAQAGAVTGSETAVGCDTSNYPRSRIPFPGPGITLTFFP